MSITIKGWFLNRLSAINAIIFEFIYDRLSKGLKDFFFIQVGACEGKTADPIRKYILKYKWRGILVEPVKYLFDQLVLNYPESDNLIFENAAISEHNEVKDFFYIKDNSNSLPEYTKGGNSFLLEQISKIKVDGYNIMDYVVTEKINCITSEELLRKHRVKKVDMLQIDAEGYDIRIIKSFPFNISKPRIIQYEITHFTKEQRRDCVDFLKDKGYIVIEKNVDTTAFLKTKDFRYIICIVWVLCLSYIVLQKLKLLG